MRVQAATSAAIRGPLPDPVPAALIARLAVARRHQGTGLGGRLLRFAVERVVVVNEAMAVTLVVARLAPRQKCGPKPKARWSFGARRMSKCFGSSKWVQELITVKLLASMLLSAAVSR